MKKLLLTLNLFCCFAIGWSQNNSVILAPNYIPDINNPNIILPLPTFGTQGNGNFVEGYEGQTPQASKNIIVDNQGKIVFFIIDQHIYDRKGKLIDAFEFTINLTGFTSANGLVSEIAVIPVPNDCNSYYLVSTGENPDAGVSYAKGYYARLKVAYDNQDNLLPESGLQLFSNEDCTEVGQSFENIIGSDYEADNNVHDERPLFAVTPMNQSGNQYLFVANGLQIFRLNITENGITYSGYKKHLSTIFPYPANNIDKSNRRREEMEVISYQGGYRLALPIQRTQSAITYRSVTILDFDGNGDFITNSEKLVDYELNAGTTGNLLIKGIELSKDGSKLYVTHNKYNQYTSTLDMFDLNTTPIAKTMVSSFDGFQHSQIESTFDVKTPIDPNQCTMLIPYQGTIAAITNANSPSFASNLDLNYSYLNVNIPATSPFSPTSTAELVKLMQDQIDYADYSFIDPDYYDKVTYSSQSSATWESNGGFNAGSNPLTSGLGNTVYIQKELKISAGTVVTIKNMNIHFAPGARLVVENSSTANGQGGKLILDGTTLTVDDRCSADVMWLGVEVWGNQSVSQGTFASSSQGRLELKNNSIIEHARIGALASQRTSVTKEICPGVNETNVLPTSFNNLRNGGIIISRNSFFLNNQKGVFIPKYYSPSNANHLARFTNTVFEWTGLLKDPSLTILYHAELIENNGIGFSGCDFINSAPTAFDEFIGQGTGIRGLTATFFVNSFCNTINQLGSPCPSADISTFQNLSTGILAVYFINAKAFSCENSTFTDCRYGIVTVNSKRIKVTANKFEVREASYQSAGIVILNSSGYTVEGNRLYEFDNPVIAHGNGNSYGVWVSNSGTDYNEIYRNHFSNLKIGGQTEKTNAVSHTATNYPNSPSGYQMNGLVWKCNFFEDDIYQNDLTLMYGSINYFQGSDAYEQTTTQLQAKRMAANNRFSRATESPSDPNYINAHDLYSTNSQSYRYVWIVGGHMEPDNYSTNNSIVVNQAGYNPTITDTTGACPNRLISRTRPQLITERKETIVKREELMAIIDKGDKELLLKYITTWNDRNAIKKELQTASPYLSDEVLLAYINSNPPSAMLKEIMLANSPLSSDVKEALNQINMPIGTRNQIFVAQTGISERTKLFSHISYLNGQQEELLNKLIQTIVFDTSGVNQYDSLEYVLLNETDLQSKELLLETNILQNDSVKYNQTRDLLVSMNEDSDYIAIADIAKELMSMPATDWALNNNPILKENVIALRDNSNRTDVKVKANAILQMVDGLDNIPDFAYGGSSAMMLNTSEQTAEVYKIQQVVTIYPNPSTGDVYFDYPKLSEGILSIKLLDINGKEVFTYNSESESNGELVNLSHVKKGFYLVHINIDGEFIEMQKLLLK